MSQVDLDYIPTGYGFAVDEERIIGSFFGDAWKGVKKVVKSPVTKAVAGGLAVVFPPVGVPASAALVAADITVRATEAKNVKAAVKMTTERGAQYALSQTKDPEQRRAIMATQTIINTATAAKKGNPHAQAAMKIMTVAKKAREASAAAVVKSGIPAGRMTPSSGQAAAIARAQHMAPRQGGAPGPGWVRTKEGYVNRGHA